MNNNAFSLPVITFAFALPIVSFTSPANCQTRVAQATSPILRPAAGVLEQEEPYDFLDEELYRKFTLFVGASLPLDEFKSNNPAVSKSGFAQFGVSGGAEYVAELTKRVGFALTGMIEGYGHDISGWKKEFPWFTFTGETRFLYWAMGGLFLDQELSRSVRMYGVAEMGLLYADYPNLKVMDAYEGTLTITAPSVATIGYGFALGGIYSSYDFSVRYLFGNPEFHPVEQFGREKTEFKPQLKPIRVVQIKFGYCLN